MCVCACVCVFIPRRKGGSETGGTSPMLCAHHVTHATSPPHTAYHGVLCAQHVCSTHSTARMLRAHHNHTCSAHSTYAMPPAARDSRHARCHAPRALDSHPAPVIHTAQHDHTCSAYNTHTPRALRTAQSRNLRRTTQTSRGLCAQHRPSMTRTAPRDSHRP